MAIFDSTSSTEGQGGDTAGPTAGRPDQITPEAITAPRTSEQTVAGPAQSAAQNLPAALEPELRRIIDTAVARVAAIELEAIREARELTQRSEHEAREALRFALDRAFNLINSLELLAATVNGMAEALRVELDDAITALRNVPEPESELARELAAEQPAPEPEPEPEVAPPAPEPAAEQPAPEPEPVAAAPEPPHEKLVAVEPQAEQPEEPRIKLTPIVRPAEVPEAVQRPAEPVPAAPDPEPDLVAVGAPQAEAPQAAAPTQAEAPAQTAAPTRPAKHKSQPPHSRKGRVRRFFTR